MSWFDKLTGFEEHSADQVKNYLRLERSVLTSLINQRKIQVGEFSTPTLSELRASVTFPATTPGGLRVRELVGDVQSLHQDSANANAVFQVASQFNCLEMSGPDLTPEDGVTIYENDRTQGPACAICAGGATIFRNYFVSVNGAEGQTAQNQIDCLSEVGRYFGNDQHRLWKMQNGYCFPSPDGLSEIEARLAVCSLGELDQLRGKLKVGVQADTEVTIGNSAHRVTQVFCSALPIAYSNLANDQWNQFPRLVLDATYEAIFWVAQRNLQRTGCNKLFLTLVGGGVFGNQIEWILSAIGRSLEKFDSTHLDVMIVSYGQSKPEVRDFLSSIDRRMTASYEAKYS